MRGGRALARAPRGGAPAPDPSLGRAPAVGDRQGATLQIELAVDGLYVLDLQQTLDRGRGALEIALELGDRPLIAAAAAALALARPPTGASSRRASTTRWRCGRSSN